MNETYVTYSQAVKLKELGFDWPCDHYYDSIKRIVESTKFARTFKVSDYWHNFNEYDRNSHSQPFYPECSAPRVDQAQKWLREVKGIAVNVIAHDGGKWEFDIVFLPNADDGLEIGNRSPWCRTYEEAMDEGITEALELLGKEDKE